MVDRSPHLWVGITDYDWFSFHSAKEKVEEVNFWSPSSNVGFRALPLGGLFLFKLKSPRNYIAGGGFFVRYEPLPINRAWETFGEANGAKSFSEFRSLIARNRHEPIQLSEDPMIGCTILTEPFFFQESDWIPFRLKSGIQRGTKFDIQGVEGRALWNKVGVLLQGTATKNNGPATIAAQENRFGGGRWVVPRLGQGSFRLMITEAYQSRCAITSERTLPALEAAHIHRYSHGGDHSLPNGLLLRSDLHRLFDRGYLAVDPNSLKIMVSPRIRGEFQNGRDYYRLEKEDRKLREPSDSRAFPSREKLIRHYEEVFKKSA
jgi:putative restriction endonuclease